MLTDAILPFVQFKGTDSWGFEVAPKFFGKSNKSFESSRDFIAENLQAGHDRDLCIAR